MSVAAKIAYLAALLFQGKRRLTVLTVQAGHADHLPHDQQASAQNLAAEQQRQADRQAEADRLLAIYKQQADEDEQEDELTELIRRENQLGAQDAAEEFERQFKQRD